MEALLARLIDSEGALEHPGTRIIVVGLVAALAAAPLIIWLFQRTGRIAAPAGREIWLRYRSWLVLTPLIVGPILLGPGAMMLAVAALGLACYHEFARATGLFRERVISAVVVAGVALVAFAQFDHWYGLFVALASLMSACIAAAGLLGDRPGGYLQRTALGVMSFVLFGFCLGHLGYMGNAPDYRPIVLLLLLCVEMNDVFAYSAGKMFGRRRLAPNTSPGKTVGGAIGALILTVALFMALGHVVFEGSVLSHPGHLLAMGVVVSAGGQLGDLVVSSVKRDVGVKDMGCAIPGHGGVLDRFDSLLLVAPAMFHYIGYFRGFGLTEPERIFTG